MEKFFRNNLSGSLWAGAAVFSVISVWYVWGTVSFVITEVRSAYGDDLIKSGEIATFDLDGAAEVQKLRGK